MKYQKVDKYYNVKYHLRMRKKDKKQKAITRRRCREPTATSYINDNGIETRCIRYAASNEGANRHPRIN